MNTRNNLKLTVITTCKNESANIAETIESVASQTYNSYEYIVIDGGSVDETVNIIKSFKNNITQFVSEPDRGIWHAMNKGIALANGEYVYFLNAGDRLFDKDTLRSIFIGNEITEDIIYGNIIDDYGSRQVRKSYADTISIRYLLSNMICHQSMFTRKGLFDKYGYFDERYTFLADYDLLWRCVIKHRVSYKHIAQTIAYYDMNGLTANPDNHPMLVREWEAVSNCNLSSFQYAYYRIIHPALVSARKLLFKPGVD